MEGFKERKLYNNDKEKVNPELVAEFSLGIKKVLGEEGSVDKVKESKKGDIFEFSKGIEKVLGQKGSVAKVEKSKEGETAEVNRGIKKFLDEEESVAKVAKSEEEDVAEIENLFDEKFEIGEEDFVDERPQNNISENIEDIEEYKLADLEFKKEKDEEDSNLEKSKSNEGRERKDILKDLETATKEHIFMSMDGGKPLEEVEAAEKKIDSLKSELKTLNIENKISEAQNIEQLIDAIEDIDSVQGSGREYSSEDLLGLIDEVRVGNDFPQSITRSFGIRGKIVDLIINDESFYREKKEFENENITENLSETEKELNNNREALAGEYSQLKEKTLGIFGSERIDNIEDAKRIATIEDKYRESLRAQRLDLFKDNQDNPEKAEQILLDTIVGEATKFYDLKTKIRTERLGNTKVEKMVKSVAKIGNWYKKQPLKVKLAVSGVLLAGGLASGYAVGAAGTALVSGLFVGKLSQRILGGTATAVGLEGLIQRSQKKQESKETLKDFNSKKLTELLTYDNAKLDKKLFDLEGSQKKKLFGRVALAGTAGVLVGSGAVGKALSGMTGWFGMGGGAEIGLKESSVEKRPFNFSKEPFEQDELNGLKERTLPSEVNEFFKAENVPDDSIIEDTKSIVENPESLIESVKIPETITIKSGDSIWKVSEKWLEENGKLEGLNEEQKTYVVDSLKDKLVKGMDNPNSLKVGQEIDFGGKFEATEIDEAVNKVQGLSEGQIKNLNDYVSNNPEVSETLDVPEDTPEISNDVKVPEASDTVKVSETPNINNASEVSKASETFESIKTLEDFPNKEIPAENISSVNEKIFNLSETLNEGSRIPYSFGGASGYFDIENITENGKEFIAKDNLGEEIKFKYIEGSKGIFEFDHLKGATSLPDGAMTFSKEANSFKILFNYGSLDKNLSTLLGTSGDETLSELSKVLPENRDYSFYEKLDSVLDEVKWYPENVKVSINEEVKDIMKEQGIKFYNGELVLGDTGDSLSFDANPDGSEITEKIEIIKDGNNLDIRVLNTDGSADLVTLDSSNNIISNVGAE